MDILLVLQVVEYSLLSSMSYIAEVEGLDWRLFVMVAEWVFPLWSTFISIKNNLEA